jgi:hypothetical protein
MLFSIVFSLVQDSFIRPFSLSADPDLLSFFNWQLQWFICFKKVVSEPIDSGESDTLPSLCNRSEWTYSSLYFQIKKQAKNKSANRKEQQWRMTDSNIFPLHTCCLHSSISHWVRLLSMNLYGKWLNRIFYISPPLITPECTIITFINFALLQFVYNCDSEHVSSFWSRAC